MNGSLNTALFHTKNIQDPAYTGLDPHKSDSKMAFFIVGLNGPHEVNPIGFHPIHLPYPDRIVFINDPRFDPVIKEST